MPSNFALTTAPVNLSTTLADGCYLVQYQGSLAGYYGAFPTSASDPSDQTGMFVVDPGEYFVVNLGADFDPVWVLGIDPGAGAGQLVIQEVPSG